MEEDSAHSGLPLTTNALSIMAFFFLGGGGGTYGWTLNESPPHRTATRLNSHISLVSQ